MRLLPARLVYVLAERRYQRDEPEIRHAAALVPAGRVAVDVGAWLGPWTRVLSRRASAVHAFEPQPRLAAHLRKVVGPNVTVHESAVGDAPGEATLVVDEGPGRDALAHLQQAQPSSTDPGRAVRVAVTRLDDVDLGDVGFVKIDVEGHELAVLRGAAQLLERCRPTVLVEIEQRHLAAPMQDTFAWLTDRGWTGWFLRDGAWQPLATFDVARDQHPWVDHLPDPRYVNDFLFRPTPEPPGPPG